MNSKQFFIGLFLFSIFYTTSSAVAAIDFKAISFSEAKILAKKEKKLIFIDAYATWCGPCKWMAANVFTDESVSDYFNKNFISLKINMEAPEGDEVGKLFPISAYPTLLAIDADGNLVRKKVGALDAVEFKKWGETAVDPSNSLYEQASKRYKSGNRALSFLVQFLVLTVEEELPTEQLVKTIYEVMPVDSLLTQNGYSVFYSFPATYASKHATHFRDNIHLFLAEYGEYALESYKKCLLEGFESNTATKEQLKAQVGRNFTEDEDAKAYFEALIDEF